MDQNSIFITIKSRIIDSSISDFGLYNGLMGDILFSFIYSRSYNDPKFYELAEQGLEFLQENIHNIKSLNRSQGLAGIGWAIEWLQQNKFLEVDTNEVLKDIESLIYRITSFSSDENISFEDGIIDKIIYFLQRNSNQNLSRYNHYVYMECLTYLSDDLYSKFCQLKNDFSVQSSFDLKNSQSKISSIADILLISGPLLKARINENICERMLYESVNITQKILDIHNTNSFAYIDSSSNQIFLKLIASLSVAGTHYGQKSWIEFSEKSCEIHLSRRLKSSIKEPIKWKYLTYLTILDDHIKNHSKSDTNSFIDLEINKIIDSCATDKNLKLYKIFVHKYLKINHIDSYVYFFI